ncbi:MAG: thiamine-phosphate kinase [Myxococcota bacterium]
MQLRDLGEFGLIDRIERASRRLGPSRGGASSGVASSGVASSGVVLGIGDDAAILRAGPREDLVVTTDALVEDVHFRWSSESPRIVGRRALVASLSDLAAMGARPLGFTCALVAPPDLPLATFDGLVGGLLREARTHGCPLVGGNLSRGRETSLTLTAMGAVTRGRALTRSGVRVGDRICVTGALGAAALDRARAESGLGRVRRVPAPRLAAGRALGRLRGMGACIDVSDGLEADLGHLLRPSGMAASLDLAAVPRPPRFSARCARLGLDPDRLVLAGGEDYELLFTLRRRAPSACVLSRRLRVPVAEIGRVTATAPGRGRTSRTSRAREREGGWRHF